MRNEEGWTSVDALVLMAVGPSRWSARPLKYVLGECDYLDRSYPDCDELSSALGALSGAGFIRERRGRFFRTQEGKRLVKGVGWRRDGSKTLLARIGRQPRTSTRYPLSIEDYERALADYLR